ncbi:cytochrome P450 [Xanthobacter agilis]|uniref:Cytochrome P450 n=1 Tax=Xanthobacter agilis TaxID=47492 RepID=A0ABU0LCK3_XANAG|nr:cytochrome P450 [Xanthobacter agilis]MDQ0504880.1 cytochrome P450 [Xanthobacter agilis]
MIRAFAGTFGRLPFAAKIAGRFLGDPMLLLGGKPLVGWQTVFTLPFRRMALVSDNATAEAVMLDRAGKFPKSTVLHALLKPLIGEGVFGQPGGDTVKETRRVLARALAAIPPAHIAEVTRTLTQEYMDGWLARKGAPAPVGVDLSRLTVDVVSVCTMGRRFTAEESQRFTDLFSIYHQRAKATLLLLAHADEATRARIIHELGLEEIGAEMRALMRERFLSAPLGRDGDEAIFSRALADAGYAAPGHDERALDEIAVMLLAGHETTASTLSWLCHVLAGDSALQDAAAQAVAAAPGTQVADDKSARFAGATGEDVLSALTQEALRLYPPIGFFLRENKEEVALENRTLPKDNFIVVAPRVLHRHRAYWKKPDTFWPERWLETPELPARTAFIPFGMGARVCPGAQFANIEMAEITRLLLTRLRFGLTAGAEPLPLGNLTSRPEPDIVLTVTPRAAPASSAQRS